MEVFWRKGYDGASLDDLTLEMGINRPSLYGAFGDKKKLFLMALERYGQGIGSAAMESFQAESDIRTAVTRFLGVALDNQCRGAGKAKGCLFANCGATVLDEHPEAAGMLSAALESSQRMIAERFEEEMHRGTLPKTFPAHVRAGMLLDFMQAQAHRARIGQSKADLAELIPARVDAVLSG